MKVVNQKNVFRQAVFFLKKTPVKVIKEHSAPKSVQRISNHFLLKFDLLINNISQPRIVMNKLQKYAYVYTHAYTHKYFIIFNFPCFKKLMFKNIFTSHLEINIPNYYMSAFETSSQYLRSQNLRKNVQANQLVI